MGSLPLSGHFPKPDEPDPPSIPLSLHQCNECGLIQLGENVQWNLLYGDHYGYRSGTTKTMRDHLKNIVDELQKEIKIKHHDIVVDIGCNDGTLLNYWPECIKVGFDPMAEKIEGMRINKDIFRYGDYRRNTSGQAKVVTAIAMFYDLQDPVEFATDIRDILDDNGIFVIEVAYSQALLSGAWDGICHEHLEYYNFGQLKLCLEKAGLRIFKTKLNMINGGSIQVWCDKGLREVEKSADLIRNIDNEDAKGFGEKIEKHAEELKTLLSNLEGTIDVYGASTKGNTLLNFCGIKDEIRFAVERDPRKVGKVTPGTRIPIIHEDESRKNPPDYYLVLPWAFKDEILEREKDLLDKVKFIFPLPSITIV